MRIAIGAPGNGALLKDALAERLAEDGRVSDVLDLSTPEITYPEVSFRVARAVAEGRVDRGLLICGTGVGTAIAANKVPGVRAATAHDLLTVRGSVENYDAQILCMGQNAIAAPAAWALIDIWLDLRHDPTSSYGPKVGEITAYEARLHSGRRLHRADRCPGHYPQHLRAWPLSETHRGRCLRECLRFARLLEEELVSKSDTKEPEVRYGR